MKPMKWSVVLLAGAIWFVQAEAYAQTCPIASSDEEAQTLARENFSAAQEAYELGRPLRALAHYRCSYQLVPHHATLYNLGVLAQGIGEANVAMEAFREYLQRYPAADAAGEIAERLATLETQQPAPPEPEPVVQPAPQPQPQPAPQPQPQPAQPQPGEQGWVSAAPPPSTLPEEPVDPSAGGRVSTGRIMAWVTMGLGVATGALGGVFMGLASSRNQEFHDEIDARELSLNELNAIGDEGYSYYVTSWIMLGTAAALLVTSTVLFAAVPARRPVTTASSRDRRFRAVLSPYVTPDSGYGLTLNGSF